MAKVLIADDSDILRTKTARILSVEGFSVLEAGNGVQAVEIYKAEKPDVVLMDLSMPEKDGLAALKEIRSFDSNAKVIMLAAVGQEPAVLNAIRGGARDYLVKPFEKERILAVVFKVIGLNA